jgi:hypothetical protein
LAIFSQGKKRKRKKGRNSKLANKVHEGNKCARNLSCHSEQEPLPTRVLENIRAREKFFLIKNSRCCAGIKSRTNPSHRLSWRLFDPMIHNCSTYLPKKKTSRDLLVKQLPVLSWKSQALCAFWNNSYFVLFPPLPFLQ